MQALRVLSLALLVACCRAIDETTSLDSKVFLERIQDAGCPIADDPVCCQGKQFGNSCLAGQAEATECSNGPCVIISEDGDEFVVSQDLTACPSVKVCCNETEDFSSGCKAIDAGLDPNKCVEGACKVQPCPISAQDVLDFEQRALEDKYLATDKNDWADEEEAEAEITLLYDFCLAEPNKTAKDCARAREQRWADLDAANMEREMTKMERRARIQIERAQRAPVAEEPSGLSASISNACEREATQRRAQLDAERQALYQQAQDERNAELAARSAEREKLRLAFEAEQALLDDSKQDAVGDDALLEREAERELENDTIVVIALAEEEVVA